MRWKWCLVLDLMLPGAGREEVVCDARGSGEEVPSSRSVVAREDGVEGGCAEVVPGIGSLAAPCGRGVGGGYE